MTYHRTYTYKTSTIDIISVQLLENTQVTSNFHVNFSFSLLIFVLSIEIIVPTRAKGVFNYTRVSGSPVSSISIYLPLFENGENVFKISRMEAKTTSGLVWTANPGPSGYDEYPDYWILTGPPLKPGDKLIVNFIMEDVRDINYELYPWKVVSDTETTITVNIEKSFPIRLVTLVEEYKYLSLIHI